MNELKPRAGDALLVVDVQNDFLPGGALGVPHGDEVVAVLNRCIALFFEKKRPVYASRDWHPVNHCSFKEQGGPWPPHCIAGTPGADFAVNLELPLGTTIVSKADRPEADAYSAFQGTNLDARLKDSGIKRLFVGGLATDYCVLNTVKDARALGYEVIILGDAVRAVNVQPGDGERAMYQMHGLGAHACLSPELWG